MLPRAKIIALQRCEISAERAFLRPQLKKPIGRSEAENSIQLKRGQLYQTMQHSAPDGAK
jgi:hypothetical protein